jgi:mannose-6-phosphate isomerase
MEDSIHHSLQKLHCSVKNYDWGLPGQLSHVAKLSELNSGVQFDPMKPYAELWIGTHESGPSFLVNDNGGDGESVSLKDWIFDNPDLLGHKVVQKWGSDLPFLFKVCHMISLPFGFYGLFVNYVIGVNN